MKTEKHIPIERMLQKLEDEEDIRAAETALKEVEEKGSSASGKVTIV